MRKGKGSKGTSSRGASKNKSDDREFSNLNRYSATSFYKDKVESRFAVEKDLGSFDGDMGIKDNDSVYTTWSIKSGDNRSTLRQNQRNTPRRPPPEPLRTTTATQAVDEFFELDSVPPPPTTAAEYTSRETQESQRTTKSSARTQPSPHPKSQSQTQHVVEPQLLNDSKKLEQGSEVVSNTKNRKLSTDTNGDDFEFGNPAAGADGDVRTLRFSSAGSSVVTWLKNFTGRSTGISDFSETGSYSSYATNKRSPTLPPRKRETSDTDVVRKRMPTLPPRRNNENDSGNTEDDEDNEHDTRSRFSSTGSSVITFVQNMSRSQKSSQTEHSWNTRLPTLPPRKNSI